MLSKSQKNFIKSLEQKKQRKASKLFLAEGVKIVNEIILSNYKLDSIFATKKWLKNNIGKLLSKQIVKITEITDEELSKISFLFTPNEVLALVNIPESNKIVSENLIIALDGIRDPGNMGTIIRTCDWFGISQIICSPDCVDIYNPKVIQASMGSFLRINIIDKELTHLKALFPQHVIYGASLSGKNIYTVKPSEKSIIIIGNESNGISEKIHSIIDHEIMIPRFGNAESLNASVASGIIINHFKMTN